MSWFRRLFGGGAEKPEAPEQTVQMDAEPPSAAAPAPDGQPLSQAALDALFFRWLAGDRDPGPLPRVEAVLLDELARLAASPDAGANLVPRVPAVIPQLLRSLRDESITASDLARQISQDVVLVAEVIREANSPFYRPATPIKTIEGAVMLLGQNGMRMLLARVSFRPIISQQSGFFARVMAPQIWRQSELCALAASLLAPRQGANPFEAYLAGLMQNVGMMVALRLIDQIYADTTLPDSDAFCSALWSHARTMSARIAGLWDFPPAVIHAIEAADAGGTQPLARTLGLSDRISKLRVLRDGGRLADDDPLLESGLPDEARAIFDKLQTEEEA